MMNKIPGLQYEKAGYEAWHKIDASWTHLQFGFHSNWIHFRVRATFISLYMLLLKHNLKIKKSFYSIVSMYHVHNMLEQVCLKLS
jgi:hypothetical protein